MALADFMDSYHIPPSIAPAYKKIELRMQNDEYNQFASQLISIAQRLTREEMDSMLGMLYHPLLRPGATKILLENCQDGNPR